jgi:thiamine biosynthesis lipoprotein
VTAPLLRRAQPWLGTLVTIQVEAAGDESAALRAMDAAFAVVAKVHALMSAHRADSDLARLACAPAGEPLVLDPHTIAVLRLAQHWRTTSRGAFDPEAAARRLARAGRRPGVAIAQDGVGGLCRLRMLDERTVVSEDGPLPLDLGGIAKGYAVDQAVQVLQAAGVHSGLVNAGGDLRAFGPRAWDIEVQHAAVTPRTRRLLRLCAGAVATSTGAAHNPDFVATRRRASCWQSGTVLARDCVTADALTKWALQEREPSLRLRAALRSSGARLWRA